MSVLLAASLLWIPDRASAENRLTRVGSAVGGFFRRVARALIPGGAQDPDLDRALETYAKGSYYTTYIHATRLGARDVESLGDEADLLRGLAAAAAGLREEAVTSLDAVLETPEGSPYVPVALATLLDLEGRLGNTRAAANAAARYLADFWARPRSIREATFKGVFLETGNLSAIVERRDEKAPTGRNDAMVSADRPTDRAVYLAGIALLTEKEFEKAAVCLEAITERSPYFPYARYGLGQAYYGLGRFHEAEVVLGLMRSAVGSRPGEPFLNDRAALLLAQMLHELDDDSGAIGWLGRVSREGPFGLHAVLLAAEIHADHEKPALALVYLKDRPESPAEPKLVARAAALDAELHRDLRDPDTAIADLERGIGVLEKYSKSLADTANANGRLDGLLKPLQLRSRMRDRVEAWRRENVGNAVPDLLDVSFEPGWLAQLFISAATRNPQVEGYPVIYYPKAYDPFSALPLPKEQTFDPPSDHAFPILFRRSLGRAVGEALTFEHDLRAALKGDDDTHLVFLLLDGELRLASGSPETSGSPDLARIEKLGLGDLVSAMIVDRRPRTEVLARALRNAEPLPRDAERHAELVALGGDQLRRWRGLERSLLREAVRTETKSVQDLRYALEFELSQTLASKKDAQKQVLQQGSLPGSPES